MIQQVSEFASEATEDGQARSGVFACFVRAGDEAVWAIGDEGYVGGEEEFVDRVFL